MNNIRDLLHESDHLEKGKRDSEAIFAFFMGAFCMALVFLAFMELSA